MNCNLLSNQSKIMTNDKAIGRLVINLLSEADDFCHVSNGVVLL